MTRHPRVLLALLGVIAGATALVLFAGQAAAAPPCAERVIDDWSDNGRIDRLYPLPCYESAIDAIPVDLRDYTNAADVIERALTAAARLQPPSDGGSGGGTGGAASSEASSAVDASAAGSIPVPLIVVVVVSLLVVLAGAVSHFTRRRRGLPGETAAD